MTDETKRKATSAWRPGLTEIERTEAFRTKVRVWFAGLTDEDQRELVAFLKSRPLLTYHALVAAAYDSQPR